jgi:NAD(P)-dependent dehydrogenase (short-subunit alcohol dehydrogenase family)
MITSFQDRLGVVTGAGSGIGREIALLLAGKGMRLALLDIDGAGLDQTTRLLSEVTTAGTFCVDVSDQPAVESAAEDIVARGGPPSLLVNSAGRLGRHDKTVWELSDQDWQAVLSVNLFGAVNTVRAFLPGMREAARAAHIVNIASVAGLWAQNRMGPYTASKHALVAFTETLQLQLSEEDSPIGVSLVCPGAVPTNLNLAFRTSDTGSSRSSSDWLGADVVARRVVDAVRQPRFYVFTHPGSRERLERYHRRLIASYE